MKKRLFAFILATVMLLTMAACGQSETKQPGDSSGSTGALFDSDTVISMVIGSHSSWPYNENWIFWKYMREAVGATIDIQSIPNTEISTKINLIMASPNQLPDLIHVISKSTADRFATTGALIAIDDHLDKMPNYVKFWDTIPEDEREELLTRRKSSDGKTYYPQNYGQERATNVRCWMYRKDIFEKHDLTPPETMDELYDTAVILKELYPDSYPLALRSGLNNLSIIGPQWKPYFTPNVYYDFANETWSYGTNEPVMLDIIEYFIKMRNEGLVPPDYLTIVAKTWEELVSTDRGFMMPEYQVRLDFFNIPAKQTNPEFMLDIMAPPRANTEAGQNKLAKYNVDPTGFIICNTGDKARIDNAIKLIDWYYSDEAADLLGWGREGETYEVVDGKRRFIIQDETPRNYYGAHTYGLYLRIDPEAADAVVSEEQAATTDFALEHTEDRYNPAQWVALNDEEARVRDDLGLAINTYRDEMLSKFILGQEPLSNWDSFQTELKDMGVEQLLDAYESAYNRVVD